MKKRNLAFFLVFALFLCSFLSVGALASETDPQRIFDQADLFSDEEERSLEEQLHWIWPLLPPMMPKARVPGLMPTIFTIPTISAWGRGSPAL